VKIKKIGRGEIVNKREHKITYSYTSLLKAICCMQLRRILFFALYVKYLAQHLIRTKNNNMCWLPRARLIIMILKVWYWFIWCCWADSKLVMDGHDRFGGILLNRSWNSWLSTQYDGWRYFVNYELGVSFMLWMHNCPRIDN
jgi:hypothetical protein